MGSVNILYLASADTSSKPIYIAGIGIEYSLTNQSPVSEVNPRLPKVSTTARCTVQNLERLYKLKIPYKTIAKKCAIPLDEK